MPIEGEIHLRSHSIPLICESLVGRSSAKSVPTYQGQKIEEIPRINFRKDSSTFARIQADSSQIKGAHTIPLGKNLQILAKSFARI